MPVRQEGTEVLFDPDHISANYLVHETGWGILLQQLHEQHRIAAVVPHNEIAVLRASEVSARLSLSWAQPEVLERFRNKAALKKHLATTDPGIRLNFARTVESPAEVLQLVREHGLSRFVLKPNDGFANVNVGIFTAGEDSDRLSAHWRRMKDSEWLLEEFVSGNEYHCNGQVDAAGNIVIVDVGRTHVRESDSGAIVCTRTDQVPSTAPEFTDLADYTKRVIRASGLRRSPFHAELRIDQKGPCLIECAARLIGAEYAMRCNEMHGPSFDVFALAAHYYGSAEDYGEPGLNWDYYNARRICKIRGVSNKAERIATLAGLAEVEALPQFRRWIDRPFIGQTLSATESLISSPYSLMVETQSAEETDEVESKVRKLVRWNHQNLGILKRVGRQTRVLGNAVARRVKQRRAETPLIAAEFE
jgi:hypothetical protein